MAYTLKRPRTGRKFWTVRIRLPGGTYELGTRCAKKSDARRVAERLHSERASANTATPLIVAMDTLVGLLTRQKRAAATIQIAEEKAVQLCKFFGPERDVNSLRLADTTAYVEHRRAKVQDSTIAKELGVLRQALRYLVKLEQYDREPGAIWPPELSHASGVRSRWLPWEEYLAVLAAMPAEWRDGYVIYTHMGLRFSELYRIEACHIDGPFLDVQGTKTSGSRRTVPINNDAAEVLERRAADHPTGPMWPSRKNANSQRTRWLKVLSQSCDRAGVEHASTNDLRRTFVSWAQQEGVPEHVLVKWMGHTSNKMVRQVYGQASNNQHASEIAKLPTRIIARKVEK